MITAGDRIPLLGGPDAEGETRPPELDLVIRNFTINCARWEQIDFSAQYYHASQKVLLREELRGEATAARRTWRARRSARRSASTSLVNITNPDLGGEPDAESRRPPTTPAA